MASSAPTAPTPLEDNVGRLNRTLLEEANSRLHASEQTRRAALAWLNHNDHRWPDIAHAKSRPP